MPQHPLPSHVPIAVARRGEHPENVHYGSVAVVDREGNLLASVGDVESPMFTRSCLKPFQAMPLISKWADRYQLDEADMALLCASHSGEAMHVSRAAALLSRAGADASSLACGCHTPFFYPATGQTPAPGERFGPLQHNCSGKHSGMLLLAQALDAPLANYLHVDHPAQQAILQSVSHFCGVSAGELVRGTDGCSAPNYAMPLRALAHAFALLTSEAPDPVYGNSPLRVAKAMCKYPELVSGQGRSDLTLMQAGGGDWVSKVGADGVQVLASFSRGVGIAAKCSDGMMPPLMVAVVAVLEQLGWLDDQRRQALRPLLPPALKNAAGVEVGDMYPALRLRFAR